MLQSLGFLLLVSAALAFGFELPENYLPDDGRAGQVVGAIHCAETRIDCVKDHGVNEAEEQAQKVAKRLSRIDDRIKDSKIYRVTPTCQCYQELEPTCLNLAYIGFECSLENEKLELMIYLNQDDNIESLKIFPKSES